MERVRSGVTEVGKKTAEKLTKLPKKGVLFLAEKGPLVTLPLTGIAIAAGTISLGLGAALMVVDVATSHWAGNTRRSMK